jgi:hypothetical protein
MVLVWQVDTLSTAQSVGLADSYGLNDIMVDGIALYCAIIILHGVGNPTTFARMQLIHSPLNAAAVSHNEFQPCVLYF